MSQKAQVFQTLLAGLRFSGISASSSKVHFYDPGTVTYKTIYEDRNKTTEAANPYTLDINGRAEVYGDGVYDVVVKSVLGATQAEWEDIALQDVFTHETIVNASNYASLNAAITAIGSDAKTLEISTADFPMTGVAVVPSTLAIQFTYPGSLQNDYTVTLNGPFTAGPYRVFSGSGAVAFGNITDVFPQWWGADGTVAGGDDAPAFQSAVNAISATGGTVLVPYGDYTFSTVLTINPTSRKRIKIKGVGRPIIQIDHAGNGIYIGDASYLTNYASGYSYVGLESLDITHTPTVDVVINVEGIRSINFEQLRMYGTVASASADIGIKLNGIWETPSMETVMVRDCSVAAIKAVADVNNGKYRGVATLASAIGWHWNAAVGKDNVNNLIEKSDIEGCALGVLVDGGVTRGLYYHYCYFEGNTGNEVEIRNTTSNKENISFKYNEMYGTNGIVFGTDPAGTELIGMVFAENYVHSTGADIVKFGTEATGKLTDSRIFNNNYAIAGIEKALLASELKTDAHRSGGVYGVMPRYSVAPTMPYGSADTKGQSGDLRWNTSKIALKTGTAWGFAQLSQHPDATSLPSLATGATPSATAKMVAKTANSGGTSITSIADGYPSQQLIIVGLDGGNTTVTNGASIKLAGAANFTLGDYDTLHLVCVDGTIWAEVSRSNN